MLKFINKVIFVFFIFINIVFANEIDNIELHKIKFNNNQVIIHFNDKAVLPIFSLDTNFKKLYLTFPNIKLAINKNNISFNDDLLENILSNSVGNNTKITLNFSKPIYYSNKINKNSLIIYFKEKNNNHKNNINSVNDINLNKSNLNKKIPMMLNSIFTKGKNEAGIIYLRSGLRFPQPQIKALDTKLELIFNDFQIDNLSQKNYDVSDFNTVVKSFRIFKLGTSTKIEIFTKEKFSYNIENKLNNFTISLKRNFITFGNNLAENILTKRNTYTGSKITLDFQDINVRTLLQIIAKESGYNIIVSDTVQGNMTISLNNIPWDQALDIILKSKNLDQRREGNVIRISNRGEFINQDKQILNAQREINEMGILQSKIFYLKYRKAQDIQSMIKSSTTGDNSGNKSNILSNRGSIMVDDLSNTIVVTDNPIVLEKFDTLINQLDVPAKQVMIEARIVEANEDFVRNFGLRYGMSKNLSNRSSIFGMENDNNSNRLEIRKEVPFSKEDTSTSYKMPLNINLPASAATSGISIIKQTASSLIALELTAMQTEGKGKIISSPKVLTQDRHKAFLEEGEDFPYLQATGLGNTNVSFKKAVTGLTVTPNITPDGNIIMELQINKDSIKDRENGAMNVKRLETKAMVENGGTIVVGGIFVEENLHGIEKVPLLGDIPVVGNLFKKRSKSNNRRELLIFITPKIVDDDFSAINY